MFIFIYKMLFDLLGNIWLEGSQTDLIQYWFKLSARTPSVLSGIVYR